MLRALWKKVRSAASWSASSLGFGGYSATDPKRKILSARKPVSRTSNELLTANVRVLRAYCRDLERNNPTARAAIEAWLAQIVGTGIALEPDTGDASVNKKIRDAWQEYCADCTVNGTDLYHLEAQGLRELSTAGELVWRWVVLPERINDGKIPLVVLPLEAEWLDDVTMPTPGIADKNGVYWVGGVGVDKYGRPTRYRLKNPELTLSVQSEEVGADQIIHEFERRRSMQARGEPWFAPIIEKLQQECDLVDVELGAAKNCSAQALVITAEAHDSLDITEDGDSEDPAQAIRYGGVARLYPGEDIKAFSHTRPSQQIRPFREMLCGDIAASMRLSRRWLNKDYGGTTYMNTRAEMLDAERLLAPVREWFGHATAGRIYKAVLPYLAVKAGVKLPRANYRLLPDGQPYVDPYKDIQGAAMAVGAGFSTWEAEIAKRGGDYRTVWAQAKRERAELESLGLSFDLSGTNAPAPESTPGAEQESEKPKPDKSDEVLTNE